MKIISPFIWLIIIFFTLCILLYFLPVYLNLGIPFKQSSVILTGSFIISVIVWLVFNRGYKLGGKTWLNHTLAAVSLKFILYLFFIIFVFFSSKNRSLEFILTFFVIYLSFTSYLLFSIVKLLKTKNL